MTPEIQTWLTKELQLLTLKPIIYLFNVDENDLKDEAKKALDELRTLGGKIRSEHE